MTSDLVAAPVDVSSPFGGLLVIESGADLAEAIGNGDWAMGVLAGAGFALDAVATVIDPLGSVIAMGIGWVLEHVEPLKSWFNELTGDAGEVAGFAQTWANIGTHLQTAGQELLNSLNEVQDLTGETMNAYRQLHTDAANHVIAAGGWSNGISGGMQAASTIVQIVHEVTRDALSEVVGTAISAAIETACTFGLATPLAISQVTTKVAALSAKVGRYVDDLLASIRKLSKHLDELMALIEKAAGAFQSAVRGGNGGPIPATAGGPNAPGSTSNPNAPSTPGGSSSGPSTPGGAPSGPATPGGSTSPSSQDSPTPDQPANPDGPSSTDAAGSSNAPDSTHPSDAKPDAAEGVESPNSSEAASTPPETTPNRGDRERLYDDGNIPEDLKEHANARQEAVDTATETQQRFDEDLGAFNKSLNEAGLGDIEANPKDFTQRNIDRTVTKYQDQLEDYPELQEQFDDLRDLQAERREALANQRDAGEAFGEAAGEAAAREHGLEPVLTDRNAGTGTFDQVYKSPDNSSLVIQEAKGPSASLGPRDAVIDGVKVETRQGSEAYLYDVLRHDEGLRQAVLNDEKLAQGLLDGSTKLEYRMVKPNADGVVTITNFEIDTNKMDIEGWLTGK